MGQTEFVVSVGQSSTIYVLYGEGTGSGGMENLLPAAGFPPISERIWLEYASTSSNYSLAIMQMEVRWGMITLPRTTTENAVLSIVIAWDDMQHSGGSGFGSGSDTTPMDQYSGGSGSGSGSDDATSEPTSEATSGSGSDTTPMDQYSGGSGSGSGSGTATSEPTSEPTSEATSGSG